MLRIGDNLAGGTLAVRLKTSYWTIRAICFSSLENYQQLNGREAEEMNALLNLVSN